MFRALTRSRSFLLCAFSYYMLRFLVFSLLLGGNAIASPKNEGEGHKVDRNKKVDMGHGSLYSSGDTLLYLFEFDFKLSGGLSTILRHSDTLRDLFKEENILKEVTHAVKQPPWDNPHVVFHPINQFILLYKFNKVWPKVSRIAHALTKNETDFSVWEKMFRADSIIEYSQLKPMLQDIKALTINDRDLKNAALGLLRLQEVYALDVEAIAKGDIRSYKSIRPLRTGEMNVLIDAAVEYDDICRALLWVRHLSIKSAAKHKMELLVELREEDQEMCDKKFCMRGDKCLHEKTQIEINYAHLCRDPDKFHSPDRTLKCGYLTHQPEFILKPLKVEWVLDDPPVFVIYDIVSEVEIKEMWDASPTLSRGILVTDDETKKFSETRTGTTAWLGDQEAPIAAKISHRVGRAINKSMDTADKWQMGNYGIGGQYYFHSDYFEPHFLTQQWFYPLGWENRLVTFMVYWNDVAEGGYTAFPILGLSIKPVKGAAVVWHNLLPDGSVDSRTYHGGCPVMIGNKKIGNKWIHYGGQHLTSPCPAEGEGRTHSYPSREL